MGLLSILKQLFPTDVNLKEEQCRPYHYDNRSRLYLPFFLIGRESVACCVNQLANERKTNVSRLAKYQRSSGGPMDPQAELHNHIGKKKPMN